MCELLNFMFLIKNGLMWRIVVVKIEIEIVTGLGFDEGIDFFLEEFFESCDLLFMFGVEVIKYFG